MSKVNKTEQVDAIIAGAGMAGLSAAITAADAGSRVVVIEKARRNWILNAKVLGQGGPGGNNTGRSGGAIFVIPVHTLFPQHRPETVEQVLEELKLTSRNCIDLEFCRYHIEHFASDIRWLEGLGCPYHASEERKASIASAGSSIWRGERCMVRVINMGVGLINFLVNTAEKKGIKILWEHTALDLLMESGKVTGLRVQGPKGILDFQGKVILATGGFEGNEEMLEQYVRPVFPHILPIYEKYEDSTEGVVRTGSPLNTGDAHRMVSKVRAKLVNMYMARCRGADILGGPGFRRFRSVQAGIAVNKYGHRVADESKPDNLGPVNPMYEGAILSVIFDEAIREKYAQEYETYPEREKCFIKAGSLEELAQKAGIDRSGLLDTVDRYNAAVQADGSAPGLPIPKLAHAVKIENPPYYTTILRAGLNDTLGGIKINTKAQVLDLENNPIPNLYACGGCTGGGLYFVIKDFNGLKSLDVTGGAGWLGGALTYGRVAGFEVTPHRQNNREMEESK